MRHFKQVKRVWIDLFVFAEENRGIDGSVWYNLVGIGPKYDYLSVTPGCLAKSEFT